MVGLDQEFTQEIPGVPMYHSVHVRSFKHLKKGSFIIFSLDVFLDPNSSEAVALTIIPLVTFVSNCKLQ